MVCCYGRQGELPGLAPEDGSIPILGNPKPKVLGDPRGGKGNSAILSWQHRAAASGRTATDIVGSTARQDAVLLGSTVPLTNR